MLIRYFLHNHSCRKYRRNLISGKNSSCNGHRLHGVDAPLETIKVHLKWAAGNTTSIILNLDAKLKEYYCPLASMCCSSSRHIFLKGHLLASLLKNLQKEWVTTQFGQSYWASGWSDLTFLTWSSWIPDGKQQYEPLTDGTSYTEQRRGMMYLPFWKPQDWWGFELAVLSQRCLSSWKPLPARKGSSGSHLEIASARISVDTQEESWEKPKTIWTVGIS